MRNKEDKKCKKGQESTIGKIIYGFLLFMPLFAIGVTCGYAMFNKNAYQSSDNQVVKKIDNLNDLTRGKEYQLTINYNTNQLSTFIFEVYSITSTNYTSDLTNVTNIRIQNSSYQFRDNTNSVLYTINGAIVSNNGYVFNFTYNNSSYNNIDLSTYNFLYYEELSLNNVFYYAVDKVTESPLFNWAENSIIYTTTNATCNALSITTPFIPLLLSYWLIISVIYFLYDIALMLVWMVHRKIHELQESF